MFGGRHVDPIAIQFQTNLLISLRHKKWLQWLWNREVNPLKYFLQRLSNLNRTLGPTLSTKLCDH